MGSKSKLKLPCIYFTEMNKMTPGSHLRNSTRTQVLKALQEYGCFEAWFVGVSPQVHKTMYDSMAQLFDLPLETKVKNVEEKPLGGYIGPTARAPKYETLGIVDSLDPHKTDAFVNLMLPGQGNPMFRETIEAYSKGFLELGEMVRRMTFEELGLDKYIEEHMDSTVNIFRFIKYLAPKKNEYDIGIVPHKDMDLLTILNQNYQGLEVMTKGGDEWIKFETVSPHSFIVMAGECLEAWSNGRIHAPLHKVTLTGSEPRFSFGCFTNPKGDYVIETPKEMVDEEHPLLFKPFNNDDFIRFYNTFDDMKERRCARQKYCGA